MAFSYDEAIAALGDALVFGTNPTLEAIDAMTEALGRPQDSYATVQIAGTNGKTSTSRLVAALLTAHGHQAGLYTSPELERYPERIEIGGAPVSDTDFAAAIEAALGVRHAGRPVDEHATEFELLTAGALWLFRERQVDFAVLEVGLGGRWDATSVTSPSVAVVTGVGLDHTAILGETREEIAIEKAAIIKPASAPILGPGTAGVERVFIERADECSTHARAVREVGEPTPVDEALTVRFALLAEPEGVAGETLVDVRGIHGDYPRIVMRAPRYQAPNIATAIAAVEAALGRALDIDAVRSAVASLVVPGRFETVAVDPLVVIDAAHNPQAAEVLADAVRDAFGSDKPVVLLAVFADKDAAGIVRALAPVAARFVVTRSRSARALEPSALATIVRDVTGTEPLLFDTVGEALEALREDPDTPVLITGSITTAGEARGLLRRR